MTGEFVEKALEPDLPIIDSHHHLFDRASDRIYSMLGVRRFLLDDYVAYLGTGHNVIASVYAEAHSMYRADGPTALSPVGETEFANGQAAMAASGLYGSTRVASAVVTYADLSLGDAVRPVLEAHQAAAPDRFRSIRVTAAWDSDPSVIGDAFQKGPHCYLSDKFREGFAHLSRLGIVFDAFVLAPQLADVEDLAKRFPETQIVLNHMGNPVGIGRHQGRMSEEFADWRMHISNIAKLDNVVVKVGGLGTFLSGSSSFRASPPVSSEVLAEEWRPYAESAIELFGAHRCMYESNVPTDAMGPFNNVCNAYKRITSGCSREERELIFAGTAKRIYNVNLPQS